MKKNDTFDTSLRYFFIADVHELRDVRRIGGGRGLRGGPGKRVDGVFPGRPQSRGQWTTAAQDDGKWRRTAEQGAECFMAILWIAAEKARAGLRHAVVCPNVTGRTKEMIAQIKWAHASSLVVVFFTLTDRASTIPSNIRGCQSGTWSAGQKNIRGTSTKLH